MKLYRLSLIAISLVFLTTMAYADRFSDAMHRLEQNVRPLYSPDDDDVKVRVTDNGGDPSWPIYRGVIPGNAVAGGREPGRTLYVCKAAFQGGVHPGKIVDGKCNITYGGREYPQDSFQIFVGSGYRWVYPRSNAIPRNAVAGGYENGQPLFICQAPYARGIHPGKIIGGSCNIGYGGLEIQIDDFRVLVRQNDWSSDFDSQFSR